MRGGNMTSKANRHGVDDWRSYGRGATMRAFVVSDPFEHARLLRLAAEWRRCGDRRRSRSAVRMARLRRLGKLRRFLSTWWSSTDEFVFAWADVFLTYAQEAQDKPQAQLRSRWYAVPRP